MPDTLAPCWSGWMPGCCTEVACGAPVWADAGSLPLTVRDPFACHAEWRAGGHMVVHDLRVAQVLAPAEPHAWYRVLAMVPAAAAFPPSGVCRLAPP